MSRKLLYLAGPLGFVSFFFWGVVAEAGGDADKRYKSVNAAYKKAVDNYSKCGSGKQVKQGYYSWLSVFNDVHFFDKNACAGDKKDARCGEVQALLKKAGKGVNAYFKSCFAHPKYDWYDTVSNLVKAQNRKPYLDEMSELDSWMAKLAKDKAGYWKDEIKKAGSQVKWSKKNNDAICYPYASAKMRKLSYLYETKNKKGFMRCVLPRDRKKYNGKTKNDFLRIYIQPGAYYEDNELKARVKWKGPQGTLAFPLKALRQKLAAKKKFHVGPWVYARVELYQSWITGKGWKTVNGKRIWGDLWTNSKLGSTTVLIKVR